MKGARIRSNSLSGTRPASTRASVPRLSAPKSARTRTSPGLGAASLSSRISARPGATYQSACAISAVLSVATISGPYWTIGTFAVLYHQVCTVPPGLEVVTAC